MNDNERGKTVADIVMILAERGFTYRDAEIIMEHIKVAMLNQRVQLVTESL